MLDVTIKGPSLVQSKYVILIHLHFQFCTIWIVHYDVVSVRSFVYLSPWHNSETAKRIRTSSTITLKSDLTLYGYLVEQLFNNILGYIHTTQPIQNYYLKHFSRSWSHTYQSMDNNVIVPSAVTSIIHYLRQDRPESLLQIYRNLC
jgi:hypothetical protein